MVRLLDSQWLDPATFESVLLKLTFQDTLELKVTEKVELFVASVRAAAVVALVSVLV
jgi:hypothetical protein